MLNKNELEKEKTYLNFVQDTVNELLKVSKIIISKSEKLFQEFSSNISASFYDMDDEEVATQQGIIKQIQQDLNVFVKKQFILQKQLISAYFGRIDFIADDEEFPQTYYIGIASLKKPNQLFPLVLDWRAPICSLYYDFTLGRAEYLAPFGKISGKVLLKRQYKTLKRELIYAFENDLTIGDDILKQVLGSNVSDKMKTIVSTIQTEQNKIIRNDENVNLIVQGVAGSGKTSIALHRVAYLIYKNKISSDEILIISPSSLFSDYINDVLPELGEQNAIKMTFDEIAKKELNGFVEFETKSEMLEDLIKGNNTRAKEVAYKSSFEFYGKLRQYFLKYFNASFFAKDIVVGKKIFKAIEINKLYNERYISKTPSIRIEWMTDYILDNLDVEQKDKKEIYERIKKVLFNMFENSDIKVLYNNFLKSLNLNLREYSTNSGVTKIGYEDVPAVLFIKDYLIGIETQKHFKHLVIDEMQDYSPIVYDLFNKIFVCKKTILGDIYQSFEKKLDENYLKNLSNLINGKMLQINTSYRSTIQISEFSQNLIKLSNIKNFNRIGENVCIYEKNDKSFYNNLSDELNSLKEKFSKIAIITPTIKQSESLYSRLSKNFEVQLIDENVGKVSEKICLLPCIFSKGLEFDAVIFIKDKNLKSDEEIYRNIEYISCTRALHKLIIFNC